MAAGTGAYHCSKKPPLLDTWPHERRADVMGGVCSLWVRFLDLLIAIANHL